MNSDRARPKARGHGQKAHRHTPRQGARGTNRDPVVSEPPGHRRYEMADEWANSMGSSGSASRTLAAELDRDASPPRSLADLKRGFSEKEWAEGWAKKISARRETDPVRSKRRTPPWHVPTKALPATNSRRDTVLPTSTSSGRQDARTPSAGASTRSRLASTCSKTARVEKSAEDPLGHRPGGDQEAPGPCLE